LGDHFPKCSSKKRRKRSPTADRSKSGFSKTGGTIIIRAPDERFLAWLLAFFSSGYRRGNSCLCPRQFAFRRSFRRVSSSIFHRKPSYFGYWRPSAEESAQQKASRASGTPGFGVEQRERQAPATCGGTGGEQSTKR
uniref:Uncharacterized protein n=1 Tax=Anopheles atroparvus TaxID=41427 RepID=A0AAG5CQY5_ANOAO